MESVEFSSLENEMLNWKKELGYVDITDAVEKHKRGCVNDGYVLVKSLRQRNRSKAFGVYEHSTYDNEPLYLLHRLISFLS